MAPESSSNENLKEAISATTRALAQDPELEISFGGIPSTGSKIVLSNPPTRKSEIASFRGKADAFACSKRFSSHEIFLDTGSTRLNNLIGKLEEVRVEILGSMKYEGVANNLNARFEDKCKAFVSIEEREDLLEPALESWLRQILLEEKLSKTQSQVLKPWKTLFNDKGSSFKNELFDSLEDQIKFAETSRKLLHALGVDQTDPNEEQDQETSDSEDSDSEENSSNPTEEELSLDSDMSQEKESSEALEDMEINEVDDDAIVDENQEMISNDSWLERLVEKTLNFEYKIYTRDYDEESVAEEMCSSEELQRLRKHLDQLMGPSKSTVSKLANRLQRFLMAQQNRSWEFNKEEGILDSSRLHKVILDPVTPLTYKVEKDTEFRDTVVSILVDSSGSMRGRSMTVAAICADIISTTLERCGVKTEVLGFTTRQWKGGESRKRWVEDGKPENPGRLNDIRHIIFKSADTPWRRGRKNFGLMLREGLLKENVDGEALIWAHDRLVMRQEQRKILMVISDGAPVDDSTLSTNPNSYLDLHLRQVIHSIETQSPIKLIAIGIGHDVTRYYQKAVTIHRAEELGGAMLDQLTDLFKIE
uniref:Cobalamin biosynthesis protein CobT (Nicotinate-mononucleotide:5, 6-dimethylbenzimidazole phosphoribosyltransferase) n=1 Tax=uncultured gamma proteobacterium HF0770_40P16 TaxID=723580 RepID=E7C7Q6_9GAMM|nr:cobalamin biosynthesis protein CobT (nicotinate-mononucleotide:5, 6-dimethylbenzimidazole phosphoribosyltransferase) [uncultured gamma proteobacterium HF0770_40P16]